MLNSPRKTVEISPFGTGSYTAVEAGRLLRTPARNIRRWMAGYPYRHHGELRQVSPLWSSQIPIEDEHVEIGFLDLVELRFVKAFMDEGMGLKAIRNCLEVAREVVVSDRPFATRRFQTDGRTIFLESLDRHESEGQLLDLKKRQYVFKRIIDRSFRDLDIEDDVVARWRPFQGKSSIVIDPDRSFGQPIVADYGVPTAVLARAVEAEGSISRVSQLYEMTDSVVRDAVKFERSLMAA